MWPSCLAEKQAPWGLLAKALLVPGVLCEESAADLAPWPHGTPPALPRPRLWESRSLQRSGGYPVGSALDGKAKQADLALVVAAGSRRLARSALTGARRGWSWKASRRGRRAVGSRLRRLEARGLQGQQRERAAKAWRWKWRRCHRPWSRRARSSCCARPSQSFVHSDGSAQSLLQDEERGLAFFHAGEMGQGMLQDCAPSSLPVWAESALECVETAAECDRGELPRAVTALGAASARAPATRTWARTLFTQMG